MSDDALGAAAHSFEHEITPPNAPAPPPRDSRGRFVENADKPEPMFGQRPIEGDPLTGDTRDGGDNEVFRAREREIADGRGEERQRSTNDDAKRVQRTAADDGHESTEIEPEDIWDIAAESEDADRADKRPARTGSDAEGTSERDAEGEGSGQERYEVIADGETFHVTLQEALRGYVREKTFYKRLNQVHQAQQEVANNDAQVRSLYAQWQQDRRNYEEDVANMLPPEPNWDHEFSVNPAQAHATQKIFQTIYAKLQHSQAMRAQREAEASAENDRRVQKYAVDGFTKFVMDNKIPDEPTLQKNLASMRKTAAAVGFNEYEVATVYDPRMLTVLLKASKYDRMMAARPRAVIPGKGRTLPPGAATPLGKAPRKGLDEALRRQASSGSLDATAEVFRRLL